MAEGRGISAKCCRALLGVLCEAHPRALEAATAAVYAAPGCGRQLPEDEALRHLMHLEAKGFAERRADPFGAGETRWAATEAGRGLP